MDPAAGPGPTTSNTFRVEPAELERAPAEGLIGDVYATLGEWILDVAEAQPKAEEEPDGVLDEPGRKAKASAGYRALSLPPARSSLSTNALA